MVFARHKAFSSSLSGDVGELKPVENAVETAKLILSPIRRHNELRNHFARASTCNMQKCKEL